LEQRPLWLALALDGIFVSAFVPLINFYALSFAGILVFWEGSVFLLFFEALSVGIVGLSFGMLLNGILKDGGMSDQTKEYLVKLSGLILFGTFFAVSIGLEMLNVVRTGCDPSQDLFQCYLAQAYPYVGLTLLLTPIVPLGTISWILAKSFVSLTRQHRKYPAQLTRAGSE